MNVPKQEMLAVAEHVGKHVNATPQVVKAAQAVVDYAACQPEATTPCPSLSAEGLALELGARANDGTGRVEWPHLAENVRRLVPGLKEPPKKAFTAPPAPATKAAKDTTE